MSNILPAILHSKIIILMHFCGLKTLAYIFKQFCLLHYITSVGRGCKSEVKGLFWQSPKKLKCCNVCTDVVAFTNNNWFNWESREREKLCVLFFIRCNAALRFIQSVPIPLSITFSLSLTHTHTHTHTYTHTHKHTDKQKF